MSHTMLTANRLITCITTAALTLMAGSSFAADKGKPEIWYQVEVVIFEQADNFDAEAPRRDEQLSYPNNYHELADPTFSLEAASIKLDTDGNPIESNTTEAATKKPTNEKEQPFQKLASSDRQLNPDAYALDRKGDYRVLYHQAWRQPGIEPRYAPWVLVRGGQRYDEHFELEGSIRLVRSRYLHIETNLWLTRFGDNFGQEPEVWPELPSYPVLALPSEDNNAAMPDGISLTSEQNDPLPLTSELTSAGAIAIEAPQQKRFIVTQVDTLKTSRRMKRKELHYLDHPRMGMLVTVTAYEVPEVGSLENETEIQTAEVEIAEPAAAEKAVTVKPLQD